MLRRSSSRPLWCNLTQPRTSTSSQTCTRALWSPSKLTRWNDYNIYLFSNTNAIHYKAFTSIYAQTAPLIGLNTDFNHFFKTAYYSHTLGQRKPELAAFEAVIQDAKLDPAQTLFIDDTISNIEGAQKAGLRTIFLSGGLNVQDVGL